MHNNEDEEEVTNIVAFPRSKNIAPQTHNEVILKMANHKVDFARELSEFATDRINSCFLVEGYDLNDLPECRALVEESIFASLLMMLDVDHPLQMLASELYKDIEASDGDTIEIVDGDGT